MKDRSKGYSTGVSKSSMIDMLTDDIKDALNERYSFYEIDANDELDTEWKNIVLAALKLVMGDVQADNDEPEQRSYIQ